MAAKRSETDWQKEKSVYECNRYMLEKEIASDVCFEVGPQDGVTVNILAHKYMLISRSPVFEAMFASGMTECQKGVEGKIRIEDITPDIFKELLLFVYCEESNVRFETAFYLMYAAKKYMLPKLVRECGKCLCEGLDVTNVLIILDHSLLFEDKCLTSACHKLISENSEVIFNEASIRRATRQVMQSILTLDTLAISEFTVYNVCIDWAKSQLLSQKFINTLTDQKIRETLGDLLYRIRFPTMEIREFARLSGDREILTLAEKESIYRFIATKNKNDRLKFPTETRCESDLCIERALKCARGEWQSYTEGDAISFKTNKNVLLTGFGMYTAHHKTGYNVDLEFDSNGTEGVYFGQLGQQKAQLNDRFYVPYTGDPTPYRITLNRPFRVNAGVMCTIKALADGSIGFYGSHCSEVCTNGDVTFTFLANQWISSNTNSSCGQIPRLFFRKS